MLTPHTVKRVVQAALEEDAPYGDLTSTFVVPASSQARAGLVAREAGILCGTDAVTAAFQLTDPQITVDFCASDGGQISPGDRLAVISGPARAVLTAERIALNFAQRMSGIATFTSRYVAAVAGTPARIVDTRKTTPGLRAFERYAVRCGGGHNHRSSLSDAVMVKDNHLQLLEASARRGDVDSAGATTPLAKVLGSRLRELPHTAHVVIEVDRLDQIELALAAGVGTVLLDNFSLADLRRAVELIGDAAITEASGGITLATVRAIAETGVQVISVGALTHSPPALDLGLDLEGADSPGRLQVD